MASLQEGLDEVAARERFSGVVVVDDPTGESVRQAYGFADRRHRIANTLSTRLATASAAKGFTALTVMSLIEEGRLALDTPVRSVLGDDLPLVAEAVTIEHLLAHRSGIGDYLDEEVHSDVNDYVMPVPVHALATSDDYLAILDGFPMVSEPGTAFAYNNGGFVILAIIAERISGIAYAELVQERVLRPAGMEHTGYLRSDELPADAAMGYLDGSGPRTNILHLPVLGTGDGGTYTTAADIQTFWRALFAGDIVSEEAVAEMVRERSQHDDNGYDRRYGLGFWLDPGGAVQLEGYDAGVSFFSEHDPRTGRTLIVISNWSDGAWPIVGFLDEALA
jgi:CubicO group peptidase (beta-lactamase class C family)